MYHKNRDHHCGYRPVASIGGRSLELAAMIDSLYQNAKKVFKGRQNARILSQNATCLEAKRNLLKQNATCLEEKRNLLWRQNAMEFQVGQRLSLAKRNESLQLGKTQDQIAELKRKSQTARTKTQEPKRSVLFLTKRKEQNATKNMSGRQNVTDIIKRDKIQAKSDKTEHKTESVEKSKVNPDKVKVIKSKGIKLQGLKLPRLQFYNIRAKVAIAEIKVDGSFLSSPQTCTTQGPMGQPVGGSKKNPPCSILTWEDLVSKFVNEFFPPSRTTNLRNEISNFQQRFDESFHEAWDRYKDLLRACPHHGFTEFHQLDTFYNALNPADQDSLNSAAGGNLLERRTQDVLTIIENKSKVRNSQNKSIVSQVKSSDANSFSSEIAKLTHGVNQQTSAVTTAMTAILKQFQATPPPASVKAVEEIYVTGGGAHPYYQCLAAGGNTFPKLRDNIQGYVVVAVVDYNQGNSGYRPLGDLAEYTIKVPPPLVQKSKPPSQRSFVVHQRDPLYPNILYPSRMHKQKKQKKDEVQIHKFWQMFKQLHINITLADALIFIPKYQRMLKALFSNKEKLLELANTPLNENFLAVILKKLPEKLGDPGKFLIPCGFSELKCKALDDLANRAICTPAGIASDVFVPIGKFTFPADFVIVDYESDPRVPLILKRPFLWTARALIDIHREEMILRDGDERLTLNMRHDTSSYSNQPQKESINMINIYDDSSEDFLEDLFATNHQSGNPTFSSHPNLTSLEVKDDVFDPEGGNVLTEKLLDLDSTKDIHPSHNVNPLSDSTTSSSPNHLLEEFANELALITFPLGNDDLPFDIKSALKEIEYLLHSDPIKDMDSIVEDSIDEDNLADLNDNLADTMPEMFTDEHALDYSSPPLYDEYDDDFLKLSPTLNIDFLPSFEYDSFLSEDFSKVDALPSTNNEDKVFNLGILIRKNIFEVITHVAPDKNVKKLATSHPSLILEVLILLSMNFFSLKKFPVPKLHSRFH
nr:hypothetical protein [Tanacetum cinerariifolium]